MVELDPHINNSADLTIRDRILSSTKGAHIVSINHYENNHPRDPGLESYLAHQPKRRKSAFRQARQYL